MKTKSIIMIIASLLLILAFTPATAVNGMCVSCQCNSVCGLFWYYCCYESIPGYCDGLAQCGGLYCGNPGINCSDCFEQCH